MATPEDDAEVITNVEQLEEVDAKDQAALDSETVDTPSVLDSTSPYSKELKGLLTQYQGALTKRSKERTAILAEAQQKLLARAEDPLGQAAMLFKVAGAFGKPTKTGSFGETLGNVGEALAPEVERMQARKDALTDLQLKYKQTGLDQDVSDLSDKIGVVTKLSQLTQGKTSEYQTLMRQLQGLDPKSPTYAADKTMLEARMKRLTFVPADKPAAGPKFEIDRLTEIVNDPNASQEAKAIAKARISKLNYIAPTDKPPENLSLEQWANKTLLAESAAPGSTPKADLARAQAIIRKSTYIAPTKDGAGGKGSGIAVSPLGKVAQDEGLTPGTPEFNARVKALQKERSEVKLSTDDRAAIRKAQEAISAGKALVTNIVKALEINEKAYEGFGASARRSIGRNLPIVGDSEGVRATTELENLMGKNALSQLKIIFGGNPTEGERQILLDLEGALSMSAGERKILFENAMAAAIRKIKENEDIIKETKSGSMHKAQTEDFADGGPVRMADGGDMQLDDEQLYQKLYGANVNYGPQGRQESAMVGAGRKVGPGYASVEGHVSRTPDASPQNFASLAARYSVPVGRGQVAGTVAQPVDVPVRLVDLQASYPVGRGNVSAGVAASRYLPANKNQVDARFLNYNRPVGSGTFNFGVSKPTQGPTQYNANYNMNFADGGAVRMQEGGTPPYVPTEEDADYSLANFGRAVGQGAGFSFGDEAIARVRAQMENRPYEEVLAEERAKYAAFASKHPYTALGTELVSGLAPSIAMSMVPGGQAPAATGLGMTVGRGKQLYDLAKTSGSAGAQGFVSGMGASEGDMGDRLSEGVTTGTTTAVVAPTVSKLITKGGQGLKAVKKAIFPTDADVSTAAINKVLNAMNRDSVGMRSLKRTMAQDAALNVKSTIADVTPSLTSLGEAVVTKPGGGKKILGDVMEKRLEAGRQSVGDKVTKAVGKNVNYADQEGKLISTLRGNADTAYKDAYAFGTVNDPRITKVLEDPTFKKAYEEARSIAEKEKLAAQLRGETDTSRFDLKRLYTVDSDGTVRVTQMPDVRTLDYIKRGIDSIIDKGFGGTNPLSKTEANALKDVKKEFVNVIDNVTKDPATGVSKYAEARAKYAGDIEVLEALRFGKDDFLKKGFMPDQAKAMVKTMSEAEKNALRAGVAQSILNDIMTRPQQINAAQIVISAPATKARLAALFDNPNDYKLFEAALEREAQLFRNAQDIARNSRTAPRAAALKDLDENPVVDITGQVLDLSASSGPGSFLAKVFKIYQQGLPMSEKVANEVAQILKTGSPRDVQKVTAKLEAQVKKKAQQAQKVAKREKQTTSAMSVSAGATPTLPEAPKPSVEERMAEEDATFEDLKKKYATEE